MEATGYRGGFMEGENGSQDFPSPMKSKTASQSLVPVTIKCLLSAENLASSDTLSIKIQDTRVNIGNVFLVACIRSCSETSTGVDYVLEDGTGTVNGKSWSDKVPQVLAAGTWVRAFGSVKSLGGNKSLNIFSLHPITEFCEVTHHFLSCMLMFAPPQVPDPLYHSNFALESITAIISIYAACKAPQGLHYASVIRALADKYSADEIRDNITWLVSEGYIFETHDSDHARVVSS